MFGRKIEVGKGFIFTNVSQSNYSSEFRKMGTDLKSVLLEVGEVKFKTTHC